MPTSPNALTPVQTSSPGQLQIIRNNSNSWTIRNVDKEARFPILIGPGGTEYGPRPPPEAIDNIQRFHQGVRGVWGGLSVYGDNPGFNFGFRQPYVWVNLTDSSVKKYIKKFDNQAMPVGATIQDAQRISKLMLSGKGVFFALTQFPLQQQNAFNETRIWNPASILTATVRKSTLGAISYPVRHVEGSDGSFLGNIKAGLLSSVGLQSAKAKVKVPGIATGADDGTAISTVASTGLGIPQKGFVRGETARKANDQFTQKWTSTSTTDDGGSFLSKLGKGLVNKLKSYIPTTKAPDADWQYRIEYRNDSNVFDAFLNDGVSSGQGSFGKGLLSYSIKKFDGESSAVYSVLEVHKYRPEKGKMYSEKAGEVNSFVSDGQTMSEPIIPSSLVDMQKALAAGTFDANKVRGVGKDVGNKRNPEDTSTEDKKSAGGNYIPTKNILTEKDISRWDSAFSRWKGISTPTSAQRFYHDGIKTYQQLNAVAKSGENYSYTKVMKSWGEMSNKAQLSNVGSQWQSDPYNELLPISGPSTSVPELLQKNQQSADMVFFYFYDLINERYIPFRATITGLNENTSADWEDVQYMGRADRLFTYKGFTRDVNFAFTVYANSIKELIPMWTRINYLTGLTRPSKYSTSTEVALSDFMYPPLITFRVGDMFVDQPAVIRSIGVTVPDDATWETTRLNGEDYKYLIGTHQEITMKGIKSRQLPTMVNISIQMSLMEKKRSLSGDWHYFDGDNL